MKVHIAKWWLVGMVMAVFVIWSDAPANAQDAKADAKAEAKKAPAKPRGVLPAYYNQVVTPEQREKIYTVQQSYADKIEALQTQLKELQAKRDGEVKAVLTADQLKKVDELAVAAKEKSKAAKAPEAAATPDKAPAAAPAKPAAPAATKK